MIEQAIETERPISPTILRLRRIQPGQRIVYYRGTLEDDLSYAEGDYRALLEDIKDGMGVHRDGVQGMRVLDLFSGVGGFSLGLERAGMTTTAFCEIDPYCQQVLRKHWPDVPIHDDIATREFVPNEADVITAGFPCQDISSLGRRAGLAGERSGLFREVVRAVRLVRPKFTLLENVADLLHRGMGTVLGELAESGHDAEWDCVPARAVGAPHGRDRVWIVAYPDSGQWRTNAVGRNDDHGPDAGWPKADGQLGTLPRARDFGEVAAFADANSSRRQQPGWCMGQVRRWLDDGFAPPSEWATPWPEVLSQISRMDDGLSDRLDKAGIDATGNAVVPQIPEMIGRAIMDAQTEERSAA